MLNIFLIFGYAGAYLQKRILNRNEIVQYFQNYKCYDADRDHFRKHLQGSLRFMKKRP